MIRLVEYLLHSVGGKDVDVDLKGEFDANTTITIFNPFNPETIDRKCPRT